MSRTEAWMIWLSSLLVGGSGVLLLQTKYLMTSDDPYAVVNHPLQPWALAAHVATAPLLVFGLGMIATSHILVRLRRAASPGRRSGLLTSLVVFPMILSGGAIQVFTEPAYVKAAVVVHVASSALFLVGLAGHLAATWRRAREAARLRDLRQRETA